MTDKPENPPAYRYEVGWDWRKVVGVSDIDSVWDLRAAEQDRRNRERAASWGIKFKIEQRLIDAERRIGWRQPK